jgi:hypothetical protein
MTIIKKIFELSEKLKEIFILGVVNILAIGTGKTHSCGRIIVERINQEDTDDLLVVSTMSNALIVGIIKEVCKCLRLYTNFENKELLENILKFEKNNSQLLKQLGIIILNTHNPLELSDLENAKVIITNHAYFFPHGHDNNYNNNCYKIQAFLTEANRKIICVFDEFDQFHKMGLEVIPLNFFVGKNFVDMNRNQVYMADHAFRYCHKAYVEKSHKQCNKDDFEDDFYYKLPEENFSKKLEKNSEGIKYFSHSIGGQYDFKTLILNNLIEVSDTKIAYCNKHGKKVGNYRIKRFDEEVRCEINSDIYQDEGITSRFLKINESIILITQKLEITDSENNIFKLDTREDVVEFAKENLTKKQWINYYKTFSSEGKQLYITRMILRKKQFNFHDSRKYYITATPGALEKLGYPLKTDNMFKTSCRIKNMDIFVVPNKASCHTDMHLFFKQLKNKDIKTFAVANKKEVIETFIKENKENSTFNNVNPIIEDSIVDVGREPSQIEINDKNVTYVYQKGNQTQGTNYPDHILSLQDGHIKIDIVERSIPIGDKDLEIINYMDSMIHDVNQSALRILRGDYKYKAIVLFLDLEEELELAEYLAEYLQKYGININTINVKPVKNYDDRITITKSIIKHVSDMHNKINLGEDLEIYTFDNNDLFNDDKREKYNDTEIINAYCSYRLIYTRDKDIKPLLNKDFGISKRQFEKLKKKNIEIIDNKLNSFMN